ncbi:unnamed protein product [Trichobilharzia regenti]|nr:unnamed protein product [Trichobilharzia regenti]
MFNYLYARRQVTNTRAAAHMAAAFKALADSTVMINVTQTYWTYELRHQFI